MIEQERAVTHSSDRNSNGFEMMSGSNHERRVRKTHTYEYDRSKEGTA